MTDLVAQLVGALQDCLDDSHQVLAQMEQMYGTNYRQDRLEAQRKTIAEARAALTAAKAGGWVAVPVEAARLAGVALSEHPGHSPLTDWEDAAMKACSLLAARPLPNPPKEQA